jgi:hypothetical protein
VSVVLVPPAVFRTVLARPPPPPLSPPPGFAVASRTHPRRPRPWRMMRERVDHTAHTGGGNALAFKQPA